MTTSVENYNSIQDTINGAQLGEKVIVNPGVYEENLVIGKDLRLLGEGKETIKIKGSLIVGSSKKISVSISGFTITEGTCPVGISITGKADVNITDCNFIQNEMFGICLFGSSKAKITKSKISENGHEGIKLWNCSQIIMDNCEVSKNMCGIAFCAYSNIRISNVTISQNLEDGIRGECFSQAHICECKVHDNGSFGFEYLESPYGDAEKKLTERITGEANQFTGNEKESIHPPNLDFLRKLKG